MQIIEEIPINIKNPYIFLNRFSEGYKTLSKALMEYIDNSFDSADDFFNDDGQYDRKVKINIEIDRENRKILIKDNCEGININTLRGLASSINDSEKRKVQKRPWVNGQFGLGAHAFRFFAQQLFVASKQKRSFQIDILIDKDQPNAKLLKTEKIDLGLSGTLIKLCNIDKTHLKNLKSDELKKEIEVYFEMLLNRNVEITITDGGYRCLCTKFNYDDVDGITINKTITSWREGSAIATVPEDKGIFINLKVCTHKIDRPPFFSRKGRRINNIANMDSFMRKTEHRKKVWENYYLTGYIEVGENLEPVITRDDFVGGKGKMLIRSGIYGEIVKIEDEIHQAIERINQDRSDENLRALASVLTEFLSEIAKEEEIKLRYENKNGKDNKGDWIKVLPDNKSDDQYEVGLRGQGQGRHKRKIIPATPDKDSNIFGRKIEGEKEGIRIEFSTLPVESTDRRAHYGDGVITIFTAHPDFVDRRGGGELEQTRITPRLANYLAAVISSEYKEVFYQQRKLEPSRKSILDEQIDFIFHFEQKMKDLINQPLDAIGNVKN